MKRVHLLVSVLFLCIVFTTIQLLLYSWARWTVDRDVKSFEYKHRNGPEEDDAFRNIREFLQACHGQAVPVFLVDPVLLSRVVDGVSGPAGECRYMCPVPKVTHFGVLSKMWANTSGLINTLESLGFSTWKYPLSAPLSHRPHNANQTIQKPLGHVLMQRGAQCLHLMVFYERNSHMWWHADTPDMGEKCPVSGNFSHWEAVYDIPELIKVTIDSVHMRAPRYPSAFLRQIPDSRFLECNQTRARLFWSKYPRPTDPEEKMQATQFQSQALEVLKNAKRVLDSIGVKFWISSGTCLGWFRQCDLISYSRDVDLGVWIEDYNPRLLPAMQQAGLLLKHRFGKESDSFELSFQGDGVKLDIFFFYHENDTMWNGGTQVRTGAKFKYIFPSFNLCWTEFLDLKLRVPCQTQAYIEANYGANWFEPVKEWDWKKSPPNVRENGHWPKEEWDKVIQTFP